MASSPAPNPATPPAKIQTRSVNSWHLGLALAGTAAIAALIGVGFGSAVRFRLLDAPSAQFLNPQQTFPPLPNWPAKAAVAPFDTPYFPGANGSPADADEDFYSEPAEPDTWPDPWSDPWADDAEPFSAEAVPEADSSDYESADSDWGYPAASENGSPDKAEPNADPEYRSEDFFPAVPSADKSQKAEQSNPGRKSRYSTASGRRKLGQL